MSAHLDLDDLTADHPQARAELEALRKGAERGRWLIEWLTQQGLLHALFCQPDGRNAPTGDYWVLQRAAMVGSGCEGYGKTEEQAIDKAMKEKT